MGTDGTAFIVEMQCYPDDFWFRRCVSYASRAYDRQNRKGEEYDVAPVYLIGLMGTGIKHADGSRWVDRYVSEYTFREKETNELQYETIFIIFAEQARFDKDMYDERRRNGELATAKRIGREEGVIAMLKKMFESGMGYQEISQISGLPESQVQAYLQK